MLLGTLAASLLRNMLAGEGIIRGAEEVIRACVESRAGFSIPSHPLTNFEIQKYENEPRFKGFY